MRNEDTTDTTKVHTTKFTYKFVITQTELARVQL